MGLDTCSGLEEIVQGLWRHEMLGLLLSPVD